MSESNINEQVENETAKNAEEWLTVKEAAERTGEKVGRIYELIKRRRITADLRVVGKRGARILVVRSRGIQLKRVSAMTSPAAPHAATTPRAFGSAKSDSPSR